MLRREERLELESKYESYKKGVYSRMTNLQNKGKWPEAGPGKSSRSQSPQPLGCVGQLSKLIHWP